MPVSKRRGTRSPNLMDDEEFEPLDDAELAQSQIDQLLQQSTFPFYMILATDQDRVMHPGRGFRKYAKKSEAIEKAKSYIRAKNTNHESFIVIEAKVTAMVGHVPEEIPVMDIEELRQKQLAKKDED